MEKIFNKKKENILKTLRFAFNNEYSDFYSKKFKYIDIDKIISYEDFKKLPILTKSELINTPYSKRTFVDFNKLNRIGFTGGTTGKPLVLPQNDTWKLLSYKFNQKELQSMGVTKILILMPMLAGYFSSISSLKKRGIILIPGDVTKISLSVKLAWEAGAEGIITTSTALEYLMKEIDKSNFDTSIIKWVSIGGESVTPKFYEEIKIVFKQAKIDLTYGSAETAATIAKSCDTIKRSTNIYHVSPNHLIESIDGKLLVTDLVTPKALPLIRYEIGDIGNVFIEKCECGQEELVEIIGRGNFDEVKFAGMMLHKVAIEHAIDRIKEFEFLDYQTVVSSVEDKYQIELILFTETLLSKDELKIIQKIFTDNLFLSSDKTASDFIKMEKILPIKISVKSEKDLTEKNKKVISNIA